MCRAIQTPTQSNPPLWWKSSTDLEPATIGELPKTPGKTPVADENEGINISSPLKPLDLRVAGHNAEELAQCTMTAALQDISLEDMWKFLDKTEENMGTTFPRLPSMQRKVEGSDPYTQYTRYLNSLSVIVHGEINKRSKGALEVIHFFDRHNNPPKDHVTGTVNRPDFVAMKLRVDESTASEFPWSALEATGELPSGNDQQEPRTKIATYTSYLLQARPDLVTVQGICVDSNGFRLVASNACGAFETGHIEWEPRASCLLLSAWIWRLYEPTIDPSITTNIKPGKPITFNIKSPETVYRNCNIQFAGTAFSRRTMVLACPYPKILIKEQYIETSRRFKEGQILSRIHKKGTFPGVVRPGWYGPVQSSRKEGIIVKWGEIERGKTRLILLDEALFIMGAKTPQEALIAMYDLLEITRFLHKKRKILHSDISYNNVLLRDVAPPYTSSTDNDIIAPVVSLNMSTVENDPPPAVIPVKQSIAEDLGEMCFASHLLHTKFNLSPGRLDTGVLLIDFDLSEDREPGNQGVDKKISHARMVRQYLDMRWRLLMSLSQGTPIFIARAVVSSMYKEDRYTLEPMPQFDQGYGTYKAAVPDRLAAFPPNKVEHYQIPNDIPHNPFKHKLQYDAESVFWLLLWWAIHAYPVGDTSSNYKGIDDRVWTALTGEQDANLDPRDGGFVSSFPRGVVVHPVYKPLESLLREMAQQLRGDH